MKRKLFLIICCLSMLLVPLIGCKPTDPVEIIRIFKAQQDAHVPTGGWGMSVPPGTDINPHPEGIQQVFSVGDKMYLGLRISSKIETNVIFCKFTYFNKGTGKEIEVGSPSDLTKAWEPSQVDLLAFYNPWSVPNELGDYEVRIYLDDKVVASARFQVKSLPSTFNLIFKYGVFAKNELNTFNGTYTKDMVQDPSITVELSLSEEELDSIYEKMVEIDFFNYPDNFTIIVPPNKPHGIVTPYSSYYFKVQHDSEIKELWWADEIIYEDIQADRLKELINLIRDIIESKDEYKSLPESKGGYM